jgi:integrase
LSSGEPKRFVTHEQVQAMAEACAQYGTLIKVLAYAGLRWGELVALTTRRVDLKRRRIEVVEAITLEDPADRGYLDWLTEPVRDSAGGLDFVELFCRPGHSAGPRGHPASD